MGANAHIYLPPWANPTEACEYAAVSAGGASASRQCFSEGDGYSACVEGIAFDAQNGSRGGASFPSYVNVSFSDAQGDLRSCLVFPQAWEEPGLGGIMLYPTSNPLWVALGLRLVKAYGGRLTYSDYSDQVDFEVPDAQALLRRADFAESNNEGFQKRQDLLLQALPLAPEEIERANALCAYPLDAEKLASFCAPYRALRQKIALETELPETRARTRKPL